MTQSLAYSEPEIIRPDGDRRLLLVCDHASAAIPPGYGDLGLSSADLARHIGWDIGAAELTRALSAHLDAPAVLARWSRLLIDVNRPIDHPGLICAESDGTPVPGNRHLTEAERARRIDNVYMPFHAAVAARIAAMGQSFRNGPAVIGIHSFTPRMAGFDRPWQVGVLWNEENPFAQRLIAALRRVPGLTVGDNEPYSGKALYHTLATHGEARGLANAGIEVRQDEIADAAGVARWAALLAALFRDMLP